MNTPVAAVVGIGTIMFTFGLVLLCHRIHRMGWSAAADHVAEDLRLLRNEHLGRGTVAQGVATAAALEEAIRTARYHARHYRALLLGETAQATSPVCAGGRHHR